MPTLCSAGRRYEYVRSAHPQPSTRARAVTLVVSPTDEKQKRSDHARSLPQPPKTRSVRLLNPRKHNWQLAPADRETTASPRRRGAC